MQNFEQFKTHLASLISVKSVKGEPKTDKPFGEDVFSAMELFLKIAKDFGFSVKNYDGYIGEVSVGENVLGESEGEIGIIGHLDVVPAGNGWESDPFTLTEKDGKFYGRGVGDDKAPMLACLYALKELKDEGVKFNKKIRLFVGGDEESGWRDAEYFSKAYGFPEYGFSPDGDFPLSYAEKGMSIVEFSLPRPKNFENVHGGTVINAVCDLAEATAKVGLDVNEKDLKKYGLILENGKIISRGKAAHGSRPELGKNAMEGLLKYMAETEDLLGAEEKLFDRTLFKSLKNEQGETTFSPDLIFVEGETLKIKCDLRIPAPLKTEDVKEVLNRLKIPYTLSEKHPPHMVEKDGWFVESLISAYNVITKENQKPISQGGSTFARVFKKGVAFGPEFPSVPSSIHEANENVRISDLMLTFDIYKEGIRRLIK